MSTKLRGLFGQILPFVFVLMAVCPLKTPAQKKSSTTESEFLNPPLIARPKALWPWVNGNFSLAQITYELTEAKAKGMAGFDIWDCGILVDPDKAVPAGPPFLGEQSMQAIAHTVREAERLKMEIGLISSSSWNAGGAWVKPKHGAMGLYRSDTVVQGPANFHSVIRFPSIPPDSRGPASTIRFLDSLTGLPAFYKEVAIIAHPYSEDSIIGSSSQVKDLSKSMNQRSELQWQVPEGKWRIVRYVCIPTGQPLTIPSPNSKGLVIDHFSKAAQEANMQFILNKLSATLGSLKNRSLKYIYEDSYEVNSAVWTPLLPDAFLKNYHYPLTNYLPVFDRFIIGTPIETNRFLFDFKKLLSNLIIENHYLKGRDMAAREGLGFYAEAGGPGEPIHNVPFEDLKALGALTVPRGEFWNKHPQGELLQIVKGISSSAHIYNQRFAEAEAFTSVWLWQEGPGELKPLADRAMCEGLNRFVYHTFPHTPPESGRPGWIYNFGTLINTTNGWWPLSDGFHHYIARACYLLQQGNFRGDIAYYYGDQAPNFVPPKHSDNDPGEGYDYDVVNTDIILNHMTVKNNRIYLPHGQYYEVLVLPHDERMNPAVLRKLMKMASAGATIIGPKPLRAYGLANAAAADREIEKNAEMLWGKCDSIHVKERNYGQGKIVWGKSLKEVLNEKGIVQDFAYSNNGRDSLDFIHRTDEETEIYFVRNKRKEVYNGELSFRVTNKQPETWRAEEGSRSLIKHFKNTGKQIAIPFTLEGEESVFIIFRTPVKNIVTQKLSIPTTEEKLVYSGNRSIRLDKAAEPISSPWTVKYAFQPGLPVTDTVNELIAWNSSSKDSVKYFGGTATYESSFNWEGNSNTPLFLEINRVREIARVYLNGEWLGDHWHQSQRFDITGKVKSGKNNLTIEVVATINNWLIGEAKKPAAFRNSRSNITKLDNAWRTPFADAKLIEAGLTGPVQLRKGTIIP
ncbi:glycosyl hydrolase [Pollutibacter soli]|uniref:glycosyl hydrolase n=1 Tax=Pollutibacter soli TaxID=3034157 RepID=UPI003013E132